MHPTSRTGGPPSDFGDLSGWPQPQYTRPGPPGAHAAPSGPPEAPRLDGLRRRAGRLDRSLITVNAACFAALVMLAGAAPGLLATEIIGRVNLGLLLCAALGAVSLYTSIRYDRRYTREVDPEAQRILARREERAAALAAAAERRAASGRRWSGW
jgi:uncharacterized membrane protein (DUF485 family)